MATTHRPRQLEQALQLLADADVGEPSPPVLPAAVATPMVRVAAVIARRLQPIAGGTDFFPGLVQGTSTHDLLDLSGLTCLRGISVVHLEGVKYLRIGASTTWSALVRRSHESLQGRAFDALVCAAAEIGGIQIQNRGTVGGNLCHASPAADGVPALVALGGQVVLRSIHNERRLAVESFVLGPRKTALAANELLEAVLIPLPTDGLQRSAFLKLGHRRYLVISAVMVAAMFRWSGDARITEARICVGSCGPAAVRLETLERRLVGLNLVELAPIDDIRGSAAYRRDAAETLVRRAIALLAETGDGRALANHG
jgi:CO/xanthine dehydrogenase FAD-binding subunit